MSIFDRMKKKRQEDMASAQPQPQQVPATPAFAQPQQPVQPKPVQTPSQLPPPKDYPYPPRDLPAYPQKPTMMEKIVTQEIQEEIMTITDEEKKEFIFIFEEKYKALNREMQQVLSKIEDAKLREKQKYEETYRNQLKVIDDHYEQQKKVVEARYLPHMERFRALSDKFREHVPVGGIQNEVKPWTQEGWKSEHQVREPQPINQQRATPTWQPAAVPGPEIDESYLNKENRFDPEISELLRKLDSTTPKSYPPRI